jgi:hypothetical protein
MAVLDIPQQLTDPHPQSRALEESLSGSFRSCLFEMVIALDLQIRIAESRV